MTAFPLHPNAVQALELQNKGAKKSNLMDVWVEVLSMPAEVLHCHAGRKNKLQFPCHLKCQWKAQCT